MLVQQCELRYRDAEGASHPGQRSEARHGNRQQDGHTGQYAEQRDEGSRHLARAELARQSLPPGIWGGRHVEQGDGPADGHYISAKIRDLRIFADDAGKMNRSVLECQGGVLVVSQFTLSGDARNGRRPSFASTRASRSARTA